MSKLFGALYLRISRDKGENEDTLQNHREIMHDFCKKNGYTFEFYQEIISGGKQSIEHRPQLQRLISNIDKYQAIFAISLDRLSRNGLVSQQIKQLCIDYDIKIITPSQEFDLANSQEDRTLFDVSSMFATMEYEMIGKRNKQNKIQRAKRGEWVSSQPPLGYKRNPETKKLEINEEEATIIRYIFKLHSQGYGSFKIRDILNEEGYKPKRSNAFNLPTIKRIIRNPAYKGTIVFNNRKRTKENGKYVYKTIESIICDNAHPPIILPDEWDNANRDRVDRAEKFILTREKPTIKSEITMLHGLVYCGKCGRKMTIRKDSKSNTGYTIKTCEYLIQGTDKKCGNNGIRVIYVEEKVLEDLKLEKEKIEKQIDLLEQNDLSNIEEEISIKISKVENQLKENEKHQNNLKELAISGVYSHDEIRDNKQKLLDREGILKQELSNLQVKLENIDVSYQIEQKKKIVQLIDEIENVPPDKQNEFLKQFVNKIIYTRDIPNHIQELSTQNIQRRTYPADVDVDYFR